MTADPTQNGPRRTDDAGHESPQSAAAERWAHGVLEFMNRDTPLEQERRVSRVMSSLATPASKMRIVLVRWAAAAALVVFTATLFALLFHSETSALATVRSAVEASRAAGTSRFAITVTPANDEDEHPIGTLDAKSGRMFLLTHRTPQGHTIIAGRDAAGEWAIHPDGAVDRTNPRMAWPPWAFLSDSTVVVGSVDDILNELEERYDLNIAPETTEMAPNAPAGSPRLRHIHAGSPRPGPLPETVDLWVDPATNLVQVMELRWRSGPRQGPGPEGQGPGGPGQPNGPGRGGRPGGPMGGPREGGGGGGGFGPPPHDRADGPLPGDRPNRVDGPGGPEGPRGPRRDGARPMDGPPGVNGPEGGPGGRVDGQRPGPDGGRRRAGPPRMIRFQRQDAPALPDNWFSPDGHAAPQRPAQ